MLFSLGVLLWTPRFYDFHKQLTLTIFTKEYSTEKHLYNIRFTYPSSQMRPSSKVLCIWSLVAVGLA